MGTSDIWSEQVRAHLPDEILERYALGQSAAHEEELVEEHLLICDSCRKSLDETDNWVALMKAGLSEYQSNSLQKSATTTTETFWDRVRHWSTPTARIPIFAGALFACFLAVWIAIPLQQQAIRDVSLRAVRGNELRVDVPAGAPIRLELEPGTGGSELNGNTAELVTADGTTIWSGKVVDARVVTPKLSPGQYWVRIHSASGQQVKEYGLQAR